MQDTLNSQPAVSEDQRMSQNNLKAKIAGIILSYGSVTFAELSRIEGFQGDEGYALDRKDLNVEIVIWSGMSEAASAALADLLEARTIAAKLCSPILYLLDGCALRYDVMTAGIAKRKQPFKQLKTYWVPLQFSAFDRVTEADRIPITLREKPQVEAPA